MTRATLLIALVCVDERSRSLRAAATELHERGMDGWADRCEAEAWRCSVARDDIATGLSHEAPLERTA